MEVVGTDFKGLWLEREDPRKSGNFYKALVRATIMFGMENWVMSPRIGKTLGGFHDRVKHWLYGKWPTRDTMGRWVYPPLDAAMAPVELQEVDMYVLHRHNPVS